MNSSKLTSANAAMLIAVTGRYLDFLRRLEARMNELHFPSEDCLRAATQLLLPHVEEHAKILEELKAWIEATSDGYRYLPDTRRRERARYEPPKRNGDVF